MNEITTVGLDLAKNVFQVHDLRHAGHDPRRPADAYDSERREAERLRDLIEQGPPLSLFWRRLVDSFSPTLLTRANEVIE
jgi:hypothetical protein